MDDSAAILDYASPRKRTALRLPAVSRLTTATSDGRLAVVEALAGQQGAIRALIFGGVVFGIVLTSGAVTAYDPHHHRWHRDWQAVAVWVAIAATGLIGCMAGVVQQTWRRTLLWAEYDGLRLSFVAPFWRRHYRWTGVQIADVVVVLTANQATAKPLGELLITRVAGGDIRLFTDHSAERLGHLATAVQAMLRDGLPHPVPPEPPRPVVGRSSAMARLAAGLDPFARVDPPSEPLGPPADPALKAEATANRLLGVRRGLRGEDGPTAGDRSR